MTTVNIGILAHVDAGKTSLTERLLFDAGVLGELGNVDAGTTRTDSWDMERRRGITIRSAVAPFPAEGRTINLIDTPGHPDFIAEVERALGVLDGAVLVISATSGVQASTKILMRTVRRLRMPTLLFVNKIDQPGVARESLLGQLRRWLSLAVTPMVTVREMGTESCVVGARCWADVQVIEAAVEALAEHDAHLLDSYLAGQLDSTAARAALVEQTRRAQAHPVFFGSARTGAGVPELVAGIAELIPAAEPGGTLCATVFKVERGERGERIAWARLRSGSLRVREPVPVFRRDRDGTLVDYRARVTTMRLGGEETPLATAGQIVQVWGIDNVRIDDRLGDPAGLDGARVFPPPAMTSVITVARPADRPRLHEALREISDQDPLIGPRLEDGSGELSLRTYGQVQIEVIRDRLREEFDLDARFAPAAPVYLEKPIGLGQAEQRIGELGPTEPFATVGLRVVPGPVDSGIRYRIAVRRGSLPRAFHTAIEQTVHQAARRGPRGWPVTDCEITLTSSGFANPISTAGDFREATGRLLALALDRAGTQVYQPVDRFELEIPEHSLGATLAALAQLDATCHAPTLTRAVALVTGVIPAARTLEFRRLLPALSQGEGALTVEPGGYQPLHVEEHGR